jgi:hypothetical protein
VRSIGRLRAWLSNQATLEALLNTAEAKAARLQRALVAANDRHEADLAALRAVHRTDVRRWTRQINEMDAACKGWQRLHADVDRQLRAVRKLAESGRMPAGVAAEVRRLLPFDSVASTETVPYIANTKANEMYGRGRH